MRKQFAVFALFAVQACSGSSESSGPSDSGGSAAEVGGTRTASTGGKVGQGGKTAASSGGMNNSGGTSSVQTAPMTGGTSGQGSAIAAGGMQPVGGAMSSGGIASGGNMSSAGNLSTGGNVSFGGSAAGLGGSVASGSTAVGGTSSTATGAGTGGVTPIGGAGSTGGASVAIGGSLALGGSSAATGGAVASGGSSAATGGAVASGGSSAATGGAVASGGSSAATGGAVASGGSSAATGGAVASGGSSAATGGAVASGGSSAASGGAVASGGTSAASGGTSSIAIVNCGIPAAGSTGVAQPSGTPGSITVVNWAGFKGAVSWTFDDGQPSQIAHYDELKATGVPLTFYIASNNSGLANFDSTWTRAVNDGSEIGNHTSHHCHADSTGCNFGTWSGSISSELTQCNTYITGHTPQKDVWTAASPFGDTGYDATDKTMFLLNRGVWDGTIGPNDSTDSSNLPCHMAAQAETSTSFNGLIDQAKTGGKWQIMLIHTISPTSDNWYNPVAITEITTSINYGKTAGMWNDSVVNVGSYWVAQKLIAGVSPTTSGSSKVWNWTLPAHFPPGKCVRVTVAGGTLKQGNATLPWDSHGYYEVPLDPGSVTLSP